MTRIYPRDSIWRSQNGRWCYKTLAGNINKFDTKEGAEHSKDIWKPQLSRLLKEGVMNKGDRLSLKLYGDSNPFELELEGSKGKTIVFSVRGKQYSLKQIKEIIAKKINKPASSISLNYNQTIHKPSNKSLSELKQEYVLKMRELKEEKANQSFDVLSVLEPIVDLVEEDIAVSEAEYLEVSNFRGDFKKYEEAQFNILSELQTISEDKRMRCYKGSLIMFLSDTDE